MKDYNINGDIYTFGGLVTKGLLLGIGLILSPIIILMDWFERVRK